MKNRNFPSPVSQAITHALLIVALFMIAGGWMTDLIGIAGAVALYFLAQVTRPKAATS